MLRKIIPSSPTMTFPRSPACRLASPGAPCCLPSGLKCGPGKRDLTKGFKYLDNT